MMKTVVVSPEASPVPGPDEQARPKIGIVPDPEVPAKPERRQFTADYKRRIVREADACTLPGEIGALLRREGLYSSHLTEWRRSLRQAEEVAFSAKKRGPKFKDPEEGELVQLRRENERLKTELRKAEVINQIQKKLSGLLGIELDSQKPDGPRS